MAASVPNTGLELLAAPRTSGKETAMKSNWCMLATAALGGGAVTAMALASCIPIWQSIFDADMELAAA